MFANFHHERHRLRFCRRHLEDVARARRGLRLAGHRAGDPRDVGPHSEALVADPVALHEVLPAASTGERHGAQEYGEPELAHRDAGIRDHLGGVGPVARGDGHCRAHREQHENRGHLEHLDAFEDGVHHRRQGQRRADDEQHADRDVVGVATPQVGRDRRRAGGPTGPQVGEEGHQREDQSPVPPEPAEPGEGRLPGGQRVALDLHVDEELGDQPHECRPHEHQAHLRGDVRVEDELPTGQPHTGGDDPGADQLEPALRRCRHLPDLGRRQLPGRETSDDRLPVRRFVRAGAHRGVLLGTE